MEPVLKTLSEKQAAILDFIVSEDYALICDGAVRTGKTTIMSMAFVIWAMEYYNDASFAICGKTVQSVERNVLRPLQCSRALPYTMDYRVSSRMLTVRCGARENRFYFFGGRDESSYMLIQGITLAGVFFDEVALMPKSFVEQALARAIACEKPKYWFSCNPESPAHYFYREWIETPRPGVRYLSLHLEDNPILTEAMIRRTREMYTGIFYDRYILGRWVAAEGIVYQMPPECITDEVPEAGDYYISCDYGTLNPFSAGLWCVSGGRAIRIREFYYSGRERGKQMTDEEYCDALERLAGDKPIRKVVVDPSAASFLTALRRRRFRVQKAQNAVLDGIRTTGGLLQSGRLLIHRSCKDALREFSLYRWDESAQTDQVIKENDHAMDDIRYFCSTVLKYLFR